MVIFLLSLFFLFLEFLGNRNQKSYEARHGKAFEGLLKRCFGK